jgi:prophage regulatory protein
MGGIVAQTGDSKVAQMLIGYKELEAKGITYSRVQLWRLEKVGKFPKRVRFSAARIAWVEAEIDAWIEALIASRK